MQANGGRVEALQTDILMHKNDDNENGDSLLLSGIYINQYLQVEVAVPQSLNE